ncbi:Uncharacterised protein [Starkeya nomas]|uniref:HTH cro/C1-type domain-containing protein n=1 Tax=Starkeya nomas TaxID=2666134 RepID=A0A5S9P102_9HYPH|nr:helix-turn-helix transcriptional regulator [Starkeya nomas]CAA0096811.1 Uncharacterised protein [Starkeya nomas]
MSDDEDARIASAALARLEAGTETLISDKDMDAYLAAPTPLAFWRKKRGLPIAELADKVGIAEDELAAMEIGLRAPSAAALRRLADVLGLTADALA